MALIDSIYNSCLSLSRKATEGMRTILNREIIKPIRPDGIISRLGLKVTKTSTKVTVETDFPDYAPWVENGRRPGKMPPPEALKDWCERHSMKGAEFAIARNIGKKGTKGKHFLLPLDRMLEMLQKAVKNNSKISLQAQYEDTFYSGVKSLEKINMKF